jgi:type I restriction enzyme S subunit
MKFNTIKLKDITSKIGDGIHGSPIYDENGEYYFINGNNLVEGTIKIKSDTKRISLDEYKKNKRELGDNTLLISINGTLGNIAKYNDEKVILGKSICYLNFINGINLDYMRFYFMSSIFQDYLRIFANGSTIKNVPLSAIRECDIRLPKLELQNKIVDCLKSIDDKIKLNNKINNNLSYVT